MDLQLPNIYCKELSINPNYEIVIKNVEQWFSKYLKFEWTDDIEITKCALYFFQKCSDINKLILIAKSITWIFMLDDYLDKNTDQIEHWLKVIERQKAITTDSLEIIYENIINELMEKPFAYSQKIRIMDGITMFVESYETSSKIRNGSLKATMDEYTGCRYADGFMHFIYVLVEYDLGLNLSDKWHIDVFRALNVKVSEHTLVTNDIYSYKKEMLTNNFPEYNYMSILRKHSNMTMEEALEATVKRIESIEIEISELMIKVKSLADEIPIEYIDRIIDIKDGNIHWSKICKRYNN